MRVSRASVCSLLLAVLCAALGGACTYDFTLGPEPGSAPSSDGGTATDKAESCFTGGCTTDCASGATCKIACLGGNCTTTCATGSTCNIECTGGNCKTTCAAGARCTITCVGGNCTCTGEGCK